MKVDFKKIIFFLLFLVFNLHAKESLITEDYFIGKLFIHTARIESNKKRVEERYIGWTYFIVSKDNSDLTLNVRFNDDEGFIGKININCKKQDCSFNTNQSLLFKVRIIGNDEIIILNSKWNDFKKNYIFRYDFNKGI